MSVFDQELDSVCFLCFPIKTSVIESVEVVQILRRRTVGLSCVGTDITHMKQNDRA